MLEISKRERARRARALLQDDLMMEALAMLEQDAIEAWGATALPETENREIYYHQLLGVKRARQQLVNWSRDTDKDGQPR